MVDKKQLLLAQKPNKSKMVEIAGVEYECRALSAEGIQALHEHEGNELEVMISMIVYGVYDNGERLFKNTKEERAALKELDPEVIAKLADAVAEVSGFGPEQPNPSISEEKIEAAEKN